MVDTTFTGTPEWYGGSAGIIRELVDRARREAEIPYQEYGRERIAPFSPLQQQAFNLAPQLAQTSPDFGQARGAIQGAIGQDIYGQQVQPYIQRGTTAPGAPDINQFLNPYREEVLQNIGRLGSRNLLENILPNVQNRFIGAGQYGSSQHQNLTNRAIRDTQEGISQAQANALHGGFNTALQAAQGQRERELQGAQVASRGAEAQTQRQLLGAEALQNLAGAQQTQGLRGVGVLSQLGGQQQQQEQNAANTAYQSFQNQRNYPFFQTARLNELVRGLPTNSQQFSSSVVPTPPQAPQASPYTQAGGLLGGVAGAYNQRQGFSHGGQVKGPRHMADGGQLSPIQRGSNAAIDTAELKSMRDQATNLSRPNVDPFWSAISRAGFNIAANRQPGVLAKLGEAGNAGLNEYHSQLGNQDERGLRSAKIMNMIDTTKRLQEERNIRNQMEREKFAEKNKQFNMSHGIHAGQLGLAREKFEHEKKLYEEGLKGPKTKGVQQTAAVRKANEEQLKEWGNRVSRGPEIIKTLNEINDLNEKIKTPEYESYLSDSSLTSPIANFLKATRAGKATVDQADALTNKLVAAKVGLLQGRQSTVAHQKAIEMSKPKKERSFEANKLLIKDDLQKEKNELEEADFGIKMFKKYKDPESGIPTVSASEIKKAYKDYAEEKNNWEATHEPGDKFPKTPEQYLTEYEGETEIESPKVPKGLEELSEEEIDAELEKTKDAA